MQNCCKGLCLLLACLLLAACTPQEASAPPPITFTDSAGHTVTLTDTPTRVAVLFSSLADIWVSAGGSVAVTVGETVERGIVPAEDVILVDGGAGKTIDTEQLIAAAPELVICSADVPAQSEVAALLRTADIPVAECRVESFADYLAVLQQFTAITRRPDLYAASGTEQAARIEDIRASRPFAGKRILFIRAGSSARSVKAKPSSDHFAATMLAELGAVNIADNAPLLLDSLSMEVILREDPDYIFFTAMGDENASRQYVEEMLQQETWRALTAVQTGRWRYLPKELFHYKPCARWAEAYAYLAALAV